MSMRIPVPAVVAAVGLSLLLGGCFTSETELITKDNAAYPFKTLTIAEVPDGSPVTFVKEGDYYVTTNAKTRGGGILLAKAGENIYVVQEPRIGSYEDSIWFFSKDRLDASVFCGSYPDATLAKHGLSLNESFVCRVKSLDQLIGLSKEKQPEKLPQFKILSME